MLFDSEKILLTIDLHFLDDQESKFQLKILIDAPLKKNKSMCESKLI